MEVVQIQGLHELAKAMRELPEKVSRSALRAGVNAAATVIRTEAKNRAPQYTGPLSLGHPPPGTLKRSVVQKQIRELSGPQQQVFFVMVRQGKKYRSQGKKGNLSQDAYYWRWVEFGTSRMGARPFLRPAFEMKKLDAVESMRVKLSERIQQLAQGRP